MTSNHTTDELIVEIYRVFDDLRIDIDKEKPADLYFRLASKLIALFQAHTDTLVRETVQLNRIELAKDIKHRHWANDSLRDAYLDAVISVSEENLAALKPINQEEDKP